RRRHLPAILDGEIWVQGFSEPEAGSDLASLRTTARKVGDSYVVDGQKLWASGGMHADWCLLLARTDPDAPKRKGISYFLLDMTTPGVEVRPIRNAVGDSHFCEIFLNDVEIPAANLVGPENAGWQVAQATLGAERGMTMLELAERLGNAGFRWLVEASPVDDPIVADRLAQFETEITGLRALCRKLVEDSTSEQSTTGPADASIVKLYYSELLQRMTDFGVEVGGLAAHTELAKPMSSGWESGSWVLDFIGSWEWTIPGGSSEIQRTIIGERGLGLPREPSSA
ncbi:acyl-CoA dehydrogenase, partial [Mycolicibacterium elephantis]|uniref:acyl-CoA dehydrogenase family protein n=1 Tax=Mycolicibacterium elephantis TaxID=81858 RepID=UPI0007E93771